MRVLRIAPAVLLLAVVAPPAAASTQPQLTKPIYSYADAIRETVYVESSIDGDGDGRKDRITTDIIRPRTTKKIPALMGMSPYHAPEPLALQQETLFPADGHTKKTVDDGHPDFFPYMYDNYFVPRGYAVVSPDMPGTRFSEGCIDLGGPNETLGAKAVIDWLGGRARAFDRTGNEVRATWTTGNVGMYGKSWDGTLANYVATTDVPNLKTIVPVVAISSWYDYTRVNGLRRFPEHPEGLAGGSLLTNQNCKEELAALSRESNSTSDYNSFWDKRNIVDDAHKVKASVFAIHGLNDTNVNMRHLDRWWQNLKAPRKLWLAISDHNNPFSYRPDEYMRTLHRWYDHWLMGIDTGIMREPAVEIERSPNVWEKSRTWPARTTNRTLRLSDHATGPQTFTDLPTLTQRQLAGTEGEGHRLLYVTPPLDKDTRLSGTPAITLRASVDAPNTPLSALLIDYGTDHRIDTEGSTLRPIPDKENCFGEGKAPDTGCYPAVEHVTSTQPFQVVSRGTMDAAHRYSLRFAVPLKPGVAETFRWEMYPQDYVFKAGHRIGLVVTANNSTDWSNYNPAQPTGPITVDPRRSEVRLPLVP